MGFSQHAGMVIVCDGTPEAARRIERVLWNDPATGVMRHADAGYEIAIDCAREKGLNLPTPIDFSLVLPAAGLRPASVTCPLRLCALCHIPRACVGHIPRTAAATMGRGA